MNFFQHSSRFFQWLYPTLNWQKVVEGKSVFLTFDDGPNPEVTSFVLKTLDEFDFKATFFCIGDNVKKHPETYKKVLEHGHSVGNHTFNHLNGFKTSTLDYINNVKRAAELIDSRLFRPPYGRIKRNQIRKLSKTYDIIMWSILTGDYSADLNPNHALQNIKKLTKNGSIIVFHDSQKAFDNLKIILPAYCQFLKSNNYLSCSL